MEHYQVEPTHSLTQVSGNWVIRAERKHTRSLSPHEVHSIMCLPRAGPVGPVYLAFLHTPQICPQNALAPSPIQIPARQLICFYTCVCVCEWELLSALYLLIVMICANAVKCHLTFVNFGLDGTLDFDLICRRWSCCWCWWWFVAEQGSASLSAYSSHLPSRYSSSTPLTTHTKLKLIELSQQPTWATAKWAIISFSSGVLIKPSLAGWLAGNKMLSYLIKITKIINNKQ